MTEAQVLALINQFIIANGNNEITANVLRPILEEMVKQPNDKIGDLPNLNTTDKTNIVAAINELINSSNSGFEIHAGSADPNVTPPSSYSIGDWYVRNGSSLYQYNGQTWVLLSSQVGGISADPGNDLTLGGDGGAYFQERTPAEIKTAYESNHNTNAFTDADVSAVAEIPNKLDTGGYNGTAQDIVNMFPDFTEFSTEILIDGHPFRYVRGFNNTGDGVVNGDIASGGVFTYEGNNFFGDLILIDALADISTGIGDTWQPINLKQI